MNFQRLPDYVVRLAATIGGILLAIFLARKVGNGQTGFVFGVLLAIFAVGIVLAIREKIWVLVPIAWGLSGQIPSLGLPFSARDLAVFFVFAAFLPLKAFKILRRKPTFGQLELICGIMAIYLVIAFVRNPVGVDAMDSDRVGGRPYFNCIVGVLAYWILSQVTLRTKNADRLGIAMLFGRMAEGVIAQLLAWFPALIAYSSLYYTCGFFNWVSNPDTAAILPGAESTQRLGHLAAIGQPLLTYLFAARPLGQMLNPFRPWWPLLVGLGVVCVFASGFRSVLFLCMAILAVATFIRHRWQGLARLGLPMTLALLLLILGNGRIFELPHSTQRALSWLPGEWSEQAVLEAKESTSWRTYMWKQMLTTDRYIQNKMLGDGFGFSKRHYETMQYFSKYGTGAEGQENFMISGNVHSGPVGAVRYAGYVGLFLLLVILVLLAREAWRIIHLAYRTPFRTLTLFICIPIAFEPVFFTLIFGAFDNAIPEAFYGLGMLRMLRNSIQASPSAPAVPPTAFHVPLPARSTRPEFAQPVAKLGRPPTA